MIVLGSIALVASVLLYIVSLIFKVEEDPRIDLVAAVLPGANCGGCGFAGCRNFAEACVKAGSTEGLACPVGGDPTMDEVRKILVPAAAEEAAPAAQAGDKKGFDPAIAAKIKALATPRAVFPLALGIK
jgi:Na+-translocating ferredoxin:NAD+ oxidoreductase RNF subunit RnfB